LNVSILPISAYRAVLYSDAVRQKKIPKCIFIARQHAYHAERDIVFSKSVRLSVCLFVQWRYFV